jgi:hypothetical protein
MFLVLDALRVVDALLDRAATACNTFAHAILIAYAMRVCSTLALHALPCRYAAAT